MNTTDVERPASELETVQPLQTGPSASSCHSANSSCASGGGGCAGSKTRAIAFLVPFLTVTAYSLSQGSACAAAGEHACTASAVAVGALAGLTSVGLVSLIKSIKHKVRAKAGA